MRASNGLSASFSDKCQPPTSCSLLLCPPSSESWPGDTKAGSTPSCSNAPGKPSARSATTSQKLQGRAGAVAVLHTHSRRLDYHPHVHLVMPAAALDATSNLWRTKCNKGSDKPYLFNHMALAKVFRAKLLAAVKQEGLPLPARLPEKWVVDCKCVGSGEKALVYLGRYLYRGVIQEKDILRCEDGQVSFRYRDAKSGKMQQRTLDGAAFLWLLLQHVLPKGFRRARNFGFLHPNSKRLIALLQLVLKIAPSPLQAWVKPRPALRCPCCGEAMQIVRRRMAAPTLGRAPDETLTGIAML